MRDKAGAAPPQRHFTACCTRHCRTAAALAQRGVPTRRKKKERRELAQKVLKRGLIQSTLRRLRSAVMAK